MSGTPGRVFEQAFADEMNRRIIDKLPSLEAAAALAEEIRTKRQKLETILELASARDNEVVAYAGSAFSLSYFHPETNEPIAALFQFWDAEARTGTDVIGRRESFLATKVIFDPMTGETWAVSPDEQTCMQYLPGAGKLTSVPYDAA